MLREEFIARTGWPPTLWRANWAGVPANRITAILNGERAVTAETALLLERRFGASAEFWMNLQTAHDLESVRAGAGEAA